MKTFLALGFLTLIVPVTATAEHLYWYGNQSFYAWPNCVATLSFATNVDGPYHYSNTLHFCLHGQAASTNHLSTNSPLTSFSRTVVTNKDGVGGTFATNFSAFFRRTMPTGFTPFAVPLDPVDANIRNVCQTFPTNTAVVTTETGNSNFSTNWLTASGWTDPEADLLPGRGYFCLNTNAEFIAEFYGWLWRTTNTVALSGFGTYKFRASKMPRAGYLADLGFDNDQSDSVSVHVWHGGQWVEVNWTEEDGWTPITGLNVSAAKGPYLEVGQPIIVEKHGSDNPSWVQPGVQ